MLVKGATAHECDKISVYPWIGLILSKRLRLKPEKQAQMIDFSKWLSEHSSPATQ